MDTTRITFRADSPKTGSVMRTIELPADTSWHAIAYVFAEFLSGMGYGLDSEAVGGDVESFIDAIEAVHDYKSEA